MHALILKLVTATLSLVAAVVVAGIMIVSFGDVTARTFARPLSGAYEITEVLVGLMVFAALPLVTYNGKHVTVGFLRTQFERNPALSLAVKIFSRCVVMAVCIFLGGHLWQLGNQFAARKASAIFAGLPLAPFAYFASAMCFLSALAAIIRPDNHPAGEEI